MMVKSPRPLTLFPKCNYGTISVKHAFSLVPGVVFINLYWKDALSEKPGAFCKHKYSSLYSQAFDVIYSLPKSSHDPDGGTWLITIQITQTSEKESNRKYILMVGTCPDYMMFS